MNKMYTALMATLLTAAVVLGQAKAPKPKSQKEVEALMAVQNATDPDARMAAVDNLIAKFADTDFKPMMLYMAAASAQQKNDFEKMVIYAERSLEADPSYYPAMIMLAEGYSTRTREFDLDKEEKLAKAEGYANKSLELLKTADKPNPTMTDEQWAAAKKDLVAQAHEALGNSAAARKKYDVAIAEYKQAVDGASSPDPATVVRMGSAYLDSGKPDAAILMFDKAIAMPDAAAPVKQMAQQLKAKAAAKAKGAGSAAPATPGAAPAPATAPAETKK